MSKQPRAAHPTLWVLVFLDAHGVVVQSMSILAASQRQADDYARNYTGIRNLASVAVIGVPDGMVLNAAALIVARRTNEMDVSGYLSDLADRVGGVA